MKREDEIVDAGESKNIETPEEVDITYVEHAIYFVADLPGHHRVTASERSLLRKLDAVIIPLAALAYFVNYLVS